MAGFPEGEGKEYDPVTGNLVYAGSFLQGQYSGAGTAYDPQTKFLRYEGNFRDGLYDGEGTLYDDAGAVIYKGNFQLGAYHGSGTVYDGATGRILQEGEFRNGVLVTSKEELEAGEETNASEAGPGASDDVKETSDSVSEESAAGI